jgi:hypothetical protein
MELEKIAPVLISIIVIILIAVISEYSKTFAAITATMPLSVPLGLWIVYAAESGDKGKMVEFSSGLLYGIIPTVIFIIATWYAARTGWSIVPIIAFGYSAWGVSLGIMLTARQLI